MVDIKNKRDIAGYLGIDRGTLYNWKRDRPNLYRTVMLGLKAEELIEKTEQSLAELKSLKDELEKTS